MEKIVVLSLGAGVQSSCLALMASIGEIKPMPDRAIFADTGDEPQKVYDWLAWLTPRLQFPVEIVRREGGPLSEETCRVRTSKAGNKYNQHAPPAFVEEGGKVALMMRQCTANFKIAQIERRLRALNQCERRGQYTQVEQWIGISLDEMQRMANSRHQWITNRWPLIEKRMSRRDCLVWMREKGFPTPPRSSCVYCPFHTNQEWQRLKTEEPTEFAKAVQFERNFQNTMGQIPNFRGRPFMHRSCRPLDQIDFAKAFDDSNQQVFGFINECEGMCGA